MTKDPETAKNGSFGLPALVAAWTVLLLAAFLWNRGMDLGRLGSSIGDLGGGPLAGRGFIDSVFGIVVASIIAASWLGLGHLLISSFKISKRENHSHILELALTMAAGAAIWSLIWFFLGIAGLYSKPAAIVAAVVGLILFGLSLRRAKEAKSESRVPERPVIFDKLLMALIAVPVALSLIGSLAPPTAKDTLLYHFALPKAFIAQGSNAFVEGNIASYLALGGEMHNVWAMLLGGLINQRSAEAAAGAVNWLFFPLLLAAVFGWARELNIGRRSSLIATLMVASIPTAYHVVSSSYIDVELALFVTLAVYSLTRWFRGQETRWLFLTAIFLGASLSLKLTSLFVFAALALLILLRAREANKENAGRIAALGLGTLLLAGLIASPWYLRTWRATGSPVFPFYMSIWEGKAEGWDVERSNLFQLMNSQYGGANKTAVDYLIAPWKLSVAAQPEDARHFDGVLGVSFLIGLPVLLFGLWKLDLAVEAKLSAGIAGVMFLFWLFSSQQLRYLLPIAPLLAIAIVAAAERVSSELRNAALFSIAAACAVSVLVSVAWFAQRAPVRVVLGGETRDEFLTRNIDYYPYYVWLNSETTMDSRVWLINMRRDTYDLERPAVSDYLFEDWTLREMVWAAHSTAELKAKIAAMDVRYVLARTDVLLDYDRSALVDDRRPRDENQAKLQMVRDVLFDRARTIMSDNRFTLIRVF